MIKFIKELLKYSYWLIPMIFWFILSVVYNIHFNGRILHDCLACVGFFYIFIIAIFTTYKAYKFNKREVI